MAFPGPKFARDLPLWYGNCAPRGGVRLPPELRSRTSLTGAPRQRHENVQPPQRVREQLETTHRNAPHAYITEDTDSLPRVNAGEPRVQATVRKPRVIATRHTPLQPLNSPYRIPAHGSRHTPWKHRTQPHIISQEEDNAAPEPRPDRRRRGPLARIPLDADDINFPKRPNPTDPAPLPRETTHHPLTHNYNLRSGKTRGNTTTNVSMSNAVIDASSGPVLNYQQLLKGPDAKICEKSCANDLGRLAQGVGTRIPSGINAIFFIFF